MSSTPDAASYLLRLIHGENSGHNLWIADESALHAARQLGDQKAHLQALTNRIDVYEALQQAGIATQLNDFAATSYSPSSLDRIFLRVSKEKPITHHVIQLAARWLKPQGELVLCGLKQDGTKTYIEKAGSYLGDSARAEKDGQIYHARLKKLTVNPAQAPDSSDYSTLRAVDAKGFQFLSKPGLFGWNKVDRGSQLLVEQLATWLPKNTAELSLLDLGCGYGYIALNAAEYGWQNIVATDNNITATETCAANLQAKSIAAEVILSDCAESIEQRFDIILCNPPFHQGTAIDSSLTDKFIRQTQRLLKPNGKALYVVNQFIGLEKKAAEKFRQHNVLIQQDGFKVIELS